MKRQAKRTVWMGLGAAGPLGLCCLLVACGTKGTGDAPDGGADLAAALCQRSRSEGLLMGVLSV